MTLNSIDSPGADADTTKEDTIFQVLQVPVSQQQQKNSLLMFASAGTPEEDAVF